MKTLMIIFIAMIFLSCNNGSTGTINDSDTLQKLNSDSVPDGKSSSPSEFNKGNSSPPGSTGGVDSTAAVGGAIPDNTRSDLEKIPDSVKKEK